MRRLISASTSLFSGLYGQLVRLLLCYRIYFRLNRNLRRLWNSKTILDNFYRRFGLPSKFLH